MKKTVIGMNLKYLYIALPGNLLMLVSLFLPFIMKDGEGGNILWLTSNLSQAGALNGLAFIYPVMIFGVGCMAVLAIIAKVRAHKQLGFLWLAMSVLVTFAATIALFMTKAVVDASGIISQKVLVANLGIGFWVLLLSAYVTLYSISRRRWILCRLFLPKRIYTR